MDIDLLKTFLEVNKARHFGRAADNLFITPAAVSARIKQLEASLGVSLFVRQRNNLRLSPEGERLVPHAEQMLLGWARLRQDIGASRALSTEIALGATPQAWSHALSTQWCTLLAQHRDVQWRMVAEPHPQLLEHLFASTLDVVILPEAPVNKELEVRRLGQVRLVMLSSQPGLGLKQALQTQYIWVDWGTPFELFHIRKFGDQPLPVLSTNVTHVALDYLRQHPACAYLPDYLLAHSEQTGLYRVKGAPGFHWPLFAVYRAGHPREDLIGSVLSRLP